MNRDPRHFVQEIPRKRLPTWFRQGLAFAICFAAAFLAHRAGWL